MPREAPSSSFSTGRAGWDRSSRRETGSGRATSSPSRGSSIDPSRVSGALHRRTTPPRLLRDPRRSPGPLEGRTVTIVGFGNQGRPQALNLRDSGFRVRVALRARSPSRRSAEKEGLETVSLERAAEGSAVVAYLLPDEEIPSVHARYFDRKLETDTLLVFAHGFTLRYGLVHPPERTRAVLVAPAGTGVALRKEYLDGGGIPALVAFESGRSAEPRGATRKDVRNRTLAYARGIGCARAGLLVTTIDLEAEVDLFGEQAVLCGGIGELVKAAFEVLVARGYPAELAYMECVHQLELTAGILSQRGILGMYDAISRTALYGAMRSGREVIGGPSRKGMERVLARIRNGDFARDWIRETERGGKAIEAFRKETAAHPVEVTGKRIRKNISGRSPRPKGTPRQAKTKI